MPEATPAADCALCPRLAELRFLEAGRNPGWHNAPVPSFGALSARKLIVGLAPGRCGAGRTGRPFTGDGAGDVLYPALLEIGAAGGVYDCDGRDTLQLNGVRITNAVRCVPPENKPTAAEISVCNGFLAAEMRAMAQLRVIVALGRIAHGAVLTACGLRASARSFAHGARHELPNGLVLFDSYHCSRYNMSTRRLTYAQLRDVLTAALTETTDR